MEQDLHEGVTSCGQIVPPMRFDSESERVLGGKLNLFSIYTDFGSFGRVRWVVNAIAKLAGHRWQYSSEMWKLDSFLGNSPLRSIIDKDGANADALIVVIGSLELRRPELMEWLESLPPVAPGRCGLLIGVLGDEECKAQELDWTAKQLIHCAQKTNRTFIWHWMQHHDGEDSDWLADSVNALLAHKQSAPTQPIDVQSVQVRGMTPEAAAA
jgi:hypothetical protein